MASSMISAMINRDENEADPGEFEIHVANMERKHVYNHRRQLLNSFSQVANPASSSVMAGLPSTLILRVYEKNIRTKTKRARCSTASFVS